MSSAPATPQDASPHLSAASAFERNLQPLRESLILNRKMRIGSALGTAALSLIWLDWKYVVSVVTLLLAQELVVGPWVLQRQVVPRLKRDPAGARHIYAALNLVGACLYAALWAPVLATGDLLGALVGASWFWGSLVTGMIYFSRDRLVFVTSVGPPVLAAAAGPFFIGMVWWAPWLALYLTAQGVAAMLLASRDRNNLKIAAETNERARQEAEQASVAKSQFLATMSHELRTPLNAIIGYAEIIEEDLEQAPDEASPDDARRIRRAARHLLTLINEVLDLSKIESGRLEMIYGPVDVAALLREVEETLHPLASARSNILRLDLVGAIPTLHTDAARLKQCVLNLATNACKFTRDGRVTIRAGLDNRNGASVLEVAVVDSGIGISAEDQARLFSPFVQVDGTETRSQDGTGLGLVITRKLAQAMGGDVSLISTAGVGSTFTLRIAAEVAQQAETPTGHAGPTVLVIEDDPTARDLTYRALTRLSFNVRATASAVEGLAWLEAARPDLVILDIHLPDMSGWQTLERIKTMAGCQHLPVLVVTIDDDRQRALSLGACEHMVKPVDRDRLTAAAVRYALPKQTPAIVAVDAAAPLAAAV